MKKCLLVTMDYAPMYGGVASYWQRVSESMPKDSWSVLTSVLANGEEGSTSIIRKPLLARFIWPRWLRGVYTMYRTYKRTQSELIVVGQILPVGTMAYVVHRCFGIPYVVQVYGMDLALAQQHSRKKRLAKLILAQARGVIANSQATADQVCEFGIERSRIEVIYPIPKPIQANQGVVQRLRTQYGLDNKTVLLSVGRLVERKGQDKTILALERVAANYPDCVYVIVGDGPYAPQLHNLVSKRNLPIVFTGAVTAEERDAWFELCDVFSMASRSLPGDREGFGMVFLEAASCAKPVIAGQGGGVSEAVVHEVTGLVIDGSSVEAIAVALDRLLGDMSYAQRLGRHGQASMQQRWSWDKMVERLKHCLV